MSTLPYFMLSPSELQQLQGVSTQPSPIEQSLSPPANLEREQPCVNGRMKNHVSRSCVACHLKHHGCDDGRPCKRCKDNDIKCTDSPKPDGRRRSTVSKLKDELKSERDRNTSLEAYIRQLEKQCCQHAQILRIHGYAQPLPLPPRHPPQNSIDPPAKQLLSIEINQDFGAHRAPSAAPSAGLSSPAGSCSSYLGYSGSDDDAFSNSSNDPSYDGRGGSSSEDLSAVSALVPPLSNFSITSGSVNSKDDDMIHRTSQRQQYLQLPRAVRGSRSDTGHGPKQTRLHQRAVSGPPAPGAFMSAGTDVAYSNMRGGGPQGIIPSIPPTSYGSEVGVPINAINHSHLELAANPAPAGYTAIPSAKSAVQYHEARPYGVNAKQSYASSMYGGAGATSSLNGVNRLFPIYNMPTLNGASNFPHSYHWDVMQQVSHSTAAIPSTTHQPESHPQQQAYQYFDHSALTPFGTTGNITTHDFNSRPPDLHITPSSPRSSYIQIFANPQ